MYRKTILAVIMLAAAIAAAGTPEAPATPRNSASIGVAAVTPLRGSFLGDMRPALTLDISRRLTRGFGIGLEGLWGFNTSRWPRRIHSSTGIDNSYLGINGFYDFMPLLRNAGRIGLGVDAGAGWGHYFNSGAVADHNFFATRCGIFFDYNFTPALALSLRTSLLWNMSDADVKGSSAAYQASRCMFMLQAGFRYRFGRPYSCAGSYGAAQIDGLNTEINHLRARVDSLEQITGTAPRGGVIREIAVDNRLNTVYDIFFHSGSATVTPDQMANVERIATHLKQNPGTDVLIEGYASSDGNAQGNIQLSLQRALAVRMLLVTRYGIDATRIETSANGVGHIFSEESWNRVCVCTVHAR